MNPLTLLPVKVLSTDSGEFLAKCEDIDASAIGETAQKALQRLKHVIGFSVQTGRDDFGKHFDHRGLTIPPHHSRMLH